MRDLDERPERAERWDGEVSQFQLGVKPRTFRFVGPVQDIALHWCLINAGEFADKLRKLKKRAIEEGRDFKRPRDPIGVPFLCGKFDLYREIFVDWWDPTTGEGFQNKEALTVHDLLRSKVNVPAKIKANPKLAKNLRFSPKSLDEKKPIRLVKAVCAMHDDFKALAGVRTWWHAFVRPLRQRKGSSDAVQEMTIVGKGGLPYTAMIQIKKISKGRKMNPADPDHGIDLVVSMDKSLPAQQMYDVKEARDADEHPLTVAEKKEAFGLYKLVHPVKITEDGAPTTKINFTQLLKLKHTNPKAVEGVKVIREAAIWPLEDMAREATRPEDMKEFMVQNGYYKPDGSPRLELIAPKKEKRDDDKSSDDDRGSQPRRRRPSDEEEVKTSSRRKKTPTKKGPTAGKRRRTPIDDDV